MVISSWIKDTCDCIIIINVEDIIKFSVNTEYSKRTLHSVVSTEWSQRARLRPPGRSCIRSFSGQRWFRCHQENPWSWPGCWCCMGAPQLGSGRKSRRDEIQRWRASLNKEFGHTAWWNIRSSVWDQRGRETSVSAAIFGRWLHIGSWQADHHYRYFTWAWLPQVLPFQLFRKSRDIT